MLAELDRHPVAEDLDADLFRAFARETVGRIRGPFLAHHAPRTTLRYLETAFRFALERQPGTVHAEVRRAVDQRGVQVLSHMDDQPFIVDTIRLFLRRGAADYWGGFNVIFHCERDDDGRLIRVGEGPMVESLALLESDAGTIGADLDASTSRLQHALELAQVTVRDFKPMRRSVERMIERFESSADRRPDESESASESAAFLKWLLRDNFVFMGAQTPGGPLGIETVEGPYQGSPEGAWTPPHAPGTVRVRKSPRESPIHRNGRIDEILVVVDEGAPTEERLFLRGMFTYRAVTQPSRNVPILRHVLKQELTNQEAVPGSFRYKGIANVFDSLPTEFLFTTPRPAISEMVDLVLDSETQQEVGVTVLTNADGTAFCLISMPKGQYSDELRRDIEDQMRSTLRCTYADHGLFVGRYDVILLHYYLTGLHTVDDGAVESLIEQVRQLATPWTNRLWQALAGEVGEDRADYFVDTYGKAFPEAYVRSTPAERAVRDILMLDALTADRTILADVFEDGDGQLVLRVYQAEDVYLTDLLPVLDHFGLIVRSSDVVRVKSRGGPLQFDSFTLEMSRDDRERLLSHRDVFLEALPAIFHGDVDNDPLNALVITAGLSAREVDVVRAYTRYERQLQIPMSLPRLQTMLLAKPDLTGRLYALFRARFDPDVADRDAAVEQAQDACDELLRRIHTHDQDIVFGGLHNLIHATVRTNAFRTDCRGAYLSFKFRCADVRDMRGQRPLFEIYVHSRDVEGLHLRFGPVARGGLRWSDRADFRTEILGLVTTQQVKNVVIVPEGSKGGFFVRNPERERDARREQADRLYQTFIRGLLDVTDNVVDGETVHPQRVVVHDEPDPYLVVAADKGTAHLSDTANAISLSYGFWLGDAFASGGSNGYDHKKVGITARGAWVLVRRHFAEMGRDPYEQSFTCVGVGDLGGDVFGNGLIESKQTKLLAAFNHLHIFLDPDPDPTASWEERKRLFDLAGRAAGWDQYDTDRISEGGGVFDRGARVVPLSPEARAMLGIERDEASPEDVIKAILRMHVDLLWMGGIGTYVKASHESHDDADDRSNDRFRVDADELGCRIVGEGANLSLTRAARIEADRCGVALNADFIDNSAGVDMSDHEVNLKILLRAPLSRGDIDEDERNALLEQLTEEVAALVLQDNDIQGRQISRDRIRSQQDIFPFGRAIAFVERVFDVERTDLGLPDEEELMARAAAGEGLTRPELAMLSSWVKRYVFKELVESGRARELEGYHDVLVNYFPVAIQERWPTDIAEHQLADEIAMTVVTTRLVGDAGAAFVPMALESTGRSVFEVADAYLRAQELAKAQEVRATLEELRTSVSLRALYGAWVQVDAGCRDVTSFWLSARNRPPTDAELVEMAEAVDRVYELQADEVVRRHAHMVEAMRADDIPADVARRILKADYLNIALMVWSHAKRFEVEFQPVAILQLAVGRGSRLQAVMDDLLSRPATGEWEPIAVRILAVRFAGLLRDLVRKVGLRDGVESVDELEPALVEGPLAPIRAHVDEMLPADAKPDIATLLVLEERLSGLIGRMASA